MKSESELVVWRVYCLLGVSRLPILYRESESESDRVKSNQDRLPVTYISQLISLYIKVRGQRRLKNIAGEFGTTLVLQFSQTEAPTARDNLSQLNSDGQT